MCLSIHLSVHTWGVPWPGPGVYPSQVQLGGGYPCGGVPHLGYPPLDLAGRLPHLAYPPSDLAGGYPDGGTPPQVHPPHWTWPGGTSTGGGYPTSYRITDGVLDTPRSVCLLRSRRRTFLFCRYFTNFLPLRKQYSGHFTNATILSSKGEIGGFQELF